MVASAVMRRLQCAAKGRAVIQAVQRTRGTAKGTHLQQTSRDLAVSKGELKIITSTANSQVKHCVKLRTDSKYRKECGAAIISGLVPLKELAAQVPNLQINTLYWDGKPQQLDICDEHLIAQYNVSTPILQKIAGTQSADGMRLAAEVAIPKMANLRDTQGALKRLLVLDGIQDPGNLGTLIRTALALGWQGVYLLPGCCELFNEKALRASRGAVFKFPFCYGSWEELKEIIDFHKLTCLAAKPKNKDNHISKGSQPQERVNKGSLLGEKGIALALGNEGSGLSSEIDAMSQAISLPMPGQMESLNVSQAGAILLFTLSKALPIHLRELALIIEEAT